mmetsp:Transcript_11907/g.27773  ORF Transcript_11907/g.27773 Transcript_11907/m.27773 type:complete len:485 (-) Transcript_11907:44-1498(-)
MWSPLLLGWSAVAFTRAEAQLSLLPRECHEFELCSSGHKADWGAFKRSFDEAVTHEATDPFGSMEVYYLLMEQHCRDAGQALDCRMGCAATFYRLAGHYLTQGFSQRAANLFQLAMSMFWDTSRSPNGMACLEHRLWGIAWFEEFMEVYLSHAAKLHRNDLAMLPHAKHWQVPPDYREPSLRIAVFSLCDYSLESPMHWLLERSKQNRQVYCQRHGYGMEWTSKRPHRSSGRHPVWGQLGGPLELLEAAESRYDWVMSMDCDSLFVNMGITIDSILYRFAARETPWGKLELDPEVHFLISEDGRGLAGGNWIIRNSPAGRAFLAQVYGNSDDPELHPYMKHDLRDQFSLLWHLVRPGVSVPTPPERPSPGQPLVPEFWPDIGYATGVRLVPQDLLLGSYPFVSCSQSGDQAHRCFQGGEGIPPDFIVSVPLLGSLPQDMAQAILDRFLLESMGSLGKPDYEHQLRALCPMHVDISRCLAGRGQQ